MAPKLRVMDAFDLFSGASSQSSCDSTAGTQFGFLEEDCSYLVFCISSGTVGVFIDLVCPTIKHIAKFF